MTKVSWGKSPAGFRIHPAIQVEGREAAREAVVVGIGVGVVSAAGVVATFLEMVRESLV